MKFDKALLIIIIALGTIVPLSCKHDGPTEEEIFMSKLSHTWTLTSGQVTLDGLDVTQAYSEMTITFGADKHYTTLHGVSPVWPASGTFTIEPSGNAITRDDGMQINIVGLTDKSVTLELQYTNPAGRSGSVSGKYKFMMTR